METIHIYTDGSCLRPNGASGWAFIFIDPIADEAILIGSQGIENSTNNRMELTAIIESLEYMESNIKYEIYTDSQLVQKCANGEWKRKSNLDLWDKYNHLKKNKKFTINWIKAHSDNKYNNFVDQLARKEAKNFQ